MKGPEDLLEHAGWLRSLARSLIADTQVADDLVQDTWVAALRRPPQHEARSWLRRVLRNAARQRFRGEKRRLERERAAAHYEALPSAEELAARMELQRMLVELVLALDEPYRSTVVLCFFEGLSAAEVARRKGIPGATVRTHLKRGVDELRRRLDERHKGGREAWSATFLPWLSTKPGIAADAGSAATTLVQGVLTMSLGAKLFFGAAAATLAFVGLRLMSPDAKEPERVEPASVSKTTNSLMVVPRIEASETVDQARRAVAIRPLPTATLEPAATRWSPVTAQVVDDHLAPLMDAVLRIPSLDAASEPTGPDGQARVVLSLEEAGRYSIEVVREGFAGKSISVLIDPGMTTELGQIVLLPGGRITGIVVDHEDLPVAEAEVVVPPRLMHLMEIEAMRRVGPDRYRGVIQRRTDAEGRFVVDGVAEGDVRVWAGAPERLWAASEQIAVRANAEPTELRLKLELPDPGEVLTGVVLSPEGTPLADCIVRADYRSASAYFARWATTGADGRFGFLAVKNIRTDFRAEDPEERWSDATLRGAESGSELVLRFRETRTIAVLVQDAEEDPVLGARVQAIARFERDTQRVGRGVSDEVEPGVLHLREPAERFMLEVQAPGYADYETEVFQPGALSDLFVVTLEELPGIHGHVLIGDRPAANVRVQLARVLVDMGSSFQVVHHQGFLTELDPYADLAVETDDEGRFGFTPQKAGDYAIRAERQGFAPGELRLRNYDPALGSRGLEIRLTQGGRIEGEVVPAPGTDVVGTQVVASRGDAHLLVQRVGADGIYRFERLIPGRWNVEVVEDDLEDLPTSHTISKERVEVPWVCEVFEGETTYYDLDLSVLEPCIVSGELVIDGEAASGWTASLRTQEGYSHRASENPRTVLDGDGRFELRVAKARSYALSLESPQGGAGFALYADLQLAPGILEWELAVETGSVVIENVLRAEDYRDYLFLEWVGADGANSLRPLEPDGEGRCTIKRFPAGPIRIRGYSVGPWNSETERALVTGRVEAGQRARFVIP